MLVKGSSAQSALSDVEAAGSQASDTASDAEDADRDADTPVEEQRALLASPGPTNLEDLFYYINDRQVFNPHNYHQHQQ